MCSKFIRKRFIESSPKDIWYGEDLAFGCILSMYNPSFIIIDEYLYYSCRRKVYLDRSISNNILDIMRSILIIKEELIKIIYLKKIKKVSIIYTYVVYSLLYYFKKRYIFNYKINY